MPGQKNNEQIARMDGCSLLKGLEHEELFEDLGLTCLPDLPCKEHLIHHGVHLEAQIQEVHGRAGN